MHNTALATALLLAATALPTPADETPPPAALNGTASPRLALPITVIIDEKAFEKPTPLLPQQGGAAKGTSEVPVNALSHYSLHVARRHFEEAGWDAKVGEGREVVIKQVKLMVTQGPTYTANVDVERRQDGKRLGMATGIGFAAPDRTNDRMAAAFVPGPFGMAAAHDASRPKAKQDAVVIEQAVLRGLDSAMMQLAAYWSGEQMQEKYMKQAAEQMNQSKGKSKKK
ncbi:MAG: hypothetical protein AB2A00_13960 [Myxococcota bacterium]